MRILSLFSGIGAFEKALSNLNIPYELVNYCEIDKYASKAYSIIHNEPESKNLFDITKVNAEALPDVDMITYGFPCQDISVAGKQAGMDTGTRSSLYHEAYRIIKEKLPKYAICENVKNLVGKKFKPQFEAILKDLEQVGYTNYYKVLNAKEYGIPQNRERVFIISILGEHKPYEFPLPFDNGLRLKDILECEVDEKYYISQEKTENLMVQLKQHNQEISYCIDSNYWKGTTPEQFLNKNRRQLLAVLSPDRKEKKQNGRRFKENGEPMFTLTGQDRHGVLQKIGSIGSDSQGNRVYSTEGIAAAQCRLAGGLGAKTGLYYTDYRIRKLTPTECWRLMGFDDSDIQKCISMGISNTQLYKMAGNSIVVNVLEEIFKKLFMEENK